MPAIDLAADVLSRTPSVIDAHNAHATSLALRTGECAWTGVAIVVGSADTADQIRF
jgi:hypothetical protein